MGVLDQTAQDSCTAFRGFVGQDSATIVTCGERLTKNLAFLQLEDDLDAPHEGMLDRRNGLGRIGSRIVETEEQRVLVVPHDRDNPNRPHNIRRHIDIGVFVV
jgi:hypothetical protein